MPKLTREEYVSKIKETIGKDESDEATALIGDLCDTYDALSAGANDSEVWKQKYEENDKAWREKYRSRFYDGDGQVTQEFAAPDPEPAKKPMNYEDLFKKKE